MGRYIVPPSDLRLARGLNMDVGARVDAATERLNSRPNATSFAGNTRTRNRAISLNTIFLCFNMIRLYINQSHPMSYRVTKM